MKRFEDSPSWQSSKKLAVDIYIAFRDCSDLGFKNQIQRAAISISNNIAEGSERNSDKELRQFLFIAKGSCGELRSMLLIAADLGYLSPDQSAELVQSATEVSQMLGGFIKKL